MTGGRRRLAEGGRIDRERLLTFTFDGRRYRGFAGDTLASALLANGVTLVGRSFKYHRPRGIMSAGVEEPAAIVQLEAGARTQPNLRATQVELYDGLRATSVNSWPNLQHDAGAGIAWFAPLLPAGFYYKTFMWPRRLWPAYETVIRHIAGLGRAPRLPDPDRYERMNAHCDVLVVGAGPAGLAAAVAAGRAGARVIVADEQNEIGGTLLGASDRIDGAPALDWVAATGADLAAMGEVRVLTRTTVTGYYDHNQLVALERVTDHLGPAAPTNRPRQRLWHIRAAQVVLATGAVERPLVFPDNDRPGTMLAGAARAYVNRFAVRPGRRAVVFTGNDSAYRAAVDLAAAGIEVAAVIDLRSEPHGAASAAAAKAGIEVIPGHTIVAVSGRRRVAAVRVMALDETGDALRGEPRRIACDLLCVAGGWTPTVHLFSQSGGRLRFDDGIAGFVPGNSVQAERSTGAAAGQFALADCLDGGYRAGGAAAAAAGFAKRIPPLKAVAEGHLETPPRAAWLLPLPPGARRGGKRIVDLQHDVTADDIAVAVREGYCSVEHLKRYTTLGMATDQGKTGNTTGIAILARQRGQRIGAVGTTTFRPPYTPLTIGAMAGRDVGALADPVRRTPMQRWHEEVGAAFEDVGQWKRPWYYSRGAETMREAVARECLAVRNGVGVMDATTLGKIDIQGPDAVTLLDRIYTNAWGSLAVGRCRYGLMLGEDGMVLDDGVTARLGEHHYLMTTTTGNAARVMAWLEEWLQTEWPELQVYLTSVSEHWATATVCGPRARRLLADLAPGFDLGPGSFGFMAAIEAEVAGLPARIFRVSFTGELSYEINVPASFGMALWNALMTAGETYDITPFGTEAMHVLRAEKGYIIVGQETDGTVTPIDLGLAWMVSRKKDFIGRRSLDRPDLLRQDRKQLVGLLTDDPGTVLPEGGQIVAAARARPPVPMIGHVTSSYHSATMGRSFALALVKGGRTRKGETVHVPLEGASMSATICDPVFYDPDGGRLRG